MRSVQPAGAQSACKEQRDSRRVGELVVLGAQEQATRKTVQADVRRSEPVKERIAQAQAVGTWQGEVAQER